MSNHLTQVKIGNSIQTMNLSDEAFQVLNLLDDLEDFTISIRKKIMEEMDAVGEVIHLNLNNF